MDIRTITMRLLGRIPSGHQCYRGPYHDGDAKFVYIENGDQKVFDGRFNYFARHGSKTLTAKGYFADDLKNGEWHMVRKSDHRTVTVTANYVMGRLTGELVCEVEEMTIGGRFFMGFCADIIDGIVTGKVVGVNNGSELEAEFDEHGQPHGDWKLTTQNKSGEVTNIDCEEWSHGTLNNSWNENRYNKRNNQKVGIFNRVNFILKIDAQPLLDLIKHGVINQHIQIHNK